MKATVIIAALALASIPSLAGCTDPEPSPRGHSPWRPVLVVKTERPPPLFQGEGGPIEVSVTNAGYVPVRAIDIEPEAGVDDGDTFKSEKKDGAAEAISPELQPGDAATATAIARPVEAGASVVRRFRVHYTEGRQGKESMRSKQVEVRLQVEPSPVNLEDARSRAKVGSQTAGVFSSILQLWAFERPDGIVIVPPQGEATAWPGISLRAFAWADLFVGNVPIRFEDPAYATKIAQDVTLTDRPDAPGEASVTTAHLTDFFVYAALDGLAVDADLDGQRRILRVTKPKK